MFQGFFHIKAGQKLRFITDSHPEPGAVPELIIWLLLQLMVSCGCLVTFLSNHYTAKKPTFRLSRQLHPKDFGKATGNNSARNLVDLSSCGVSASLRVSVTYFLDGARLAILMQQLLNAALCWLSDEMILQLVLALKAQTPTDSVASFPKMHVLKLAEGGVLT